MSEKENDSNQDQVLGHSFDGIEEYDNDLPRWWLQIFWVTAVFAIGYTVYMHGGFVEPVDDRLARELAELEAMKAPAPAATAAKAGVPESERLVALAANTAAVASGKTVYEQKCAACHRPDAGGLVGPNLTDEYWIHGGSIEEIKHVVVEGVPAKGMLAWKTMLGAAEIDNVVAYIWTIRGSNPANPKEPQGDKVSH